MGTPRRGVTPSPIPGGSANPNTLCLCSHRRTGLRASDTDLPHPLPPTSAAQVPEDDGTTGAHQGRAPTWT